jgi:hypothetical protein
MITSEGILQGQLSGHGKITKCKIVHDNEEVECVAKPVSHKEGVYKELQGTPIMSIIPKFYGIMNVDGVDCVMIENIIEGFESPCIADIKCGIRPYDLEATPEKTKRALKEQEGSTSYTLYIRGESIATRKGGNLESNLIKKNLLKYNDSELIAAIKGFIPQNLVQIYEEQMRNMISVFEAMKREYPYFRIYAGSVMIAYDGDAKDKIRLKIIDLSHTYLDISKCVDNPDDKQYDDGFLEGLKSLLKIAYA